MPSCFKTFGPNQLVLRAALVGTVLNNSCFLFSLPKKKTFPYSACTKSLWSTFTTLNMFSERKGSEHKSFL